MSRIALNPDQVAQFRSARDITPYTIYDSIVVGEGARALDPGWYNTFQEFAGSNSLNIFAGRQGSVGTAFTNMSDPRRDWAMNLSMMQIESFTTTPGLADYLSSPHDAQFLPSLWCDKLLQQTTFQLGLGDQSDNMLSIPLNHVPSGFGASGGQMDGSAAPAMATITNGVPSTSNAFFWPKSGMLELPAKAKLDLYLSVSNPIRGLMTDPNFPLPGRVVVNNNGEEVTAPILYVLRFSFKGMRAVQMRGARSA